MKTSIIEINNLSKQYYVTKGTRQAYSYKSVRDILADSVKNLFSKKVKKESRQLFTALKNINCEIFEGDVVGIVGKNGAGKSTLLKILSRITSPTNGKIKIIGRVGTLLEVGTGFHPELTGRENIALNGAILGLKRYEVASKSKEIIDFSGVEDFIDMPIKRYSSGMVMRLAFSVAAHLEPEIMIVDEVLATGDAEFQKKCLGKMKDVSRSGRTVIFVSHNIGAIENLCNRCLWLEKGELRADSKDVTKTIANYLQYNQEIRDYSWYNDGSILQDEVFTPKSFAATDSEGNIINFPISSDKEIYIKINFSMHKMLHNLLLGYAIYDSAGQMLYYSYNLDHIDFSNEDLKKGDNNIQALIPKNILNDGEYTIEMIAGLIGDRPILIRNSYIISFTLQIMGNTKRTSIWENPRPSKLAPVLKWEVCNH